MKTVTTSKKPLSPAQRMKSFQLQPAKSLATQIASRLRQAIIIGPQRLAAVVLGTGEVQRIGRPQPESGRERRCIEINRLRHIDRGQAFEKFDKVAAQHGIAALKRANETFHFGQGRDGEPAKPGFSESQRNVSAPNGMFLHEVDGDAGIEIGAPRLGQLLR